MQIKNIKSYANLNERYGILTLRLGVMVFLILNFHWLNGHPFRVDLINFAELSYLLSIALIFIFTKKQKLPIESRWPKLVFDFFFATAFVGVSLWKMGAHSGFYVLYLIPIIYCSYWFGKVATFSFVTAVSVIYCFSNYFLLGMSNEFKSVKEMANVLSPLVIIFYVVAIGGIYYKQKSQRSAILSREKDYTRSLLKSSFDAIIAVDETGRLTEVNERACDLLGYGLGDIVGKTVKDFYAPGEAVKVMKKLKDSSDGAIENFNTYILSLKREKIPILLAASFLYDRKLNFKEEISKGRRFPSIGYFRDKRVEEVVDNISMDIATISDEKKLLDKIAQTVAETLHAEACSILTHDGSSGFLELISSYGLPIALSKGERGETYRTENDGTIAKVFFQKQTVNISDIDVSRKKPENASIKWRYAENFAKYSRFRDFKHFLGTPLVVQGEVYGVIRLLNKYINENELDKQGFTENDQKVLERISNQVSFLIEKVLGKGRINAILKVGQELNQMLDISLDELLETIAKEVVEGMQFKACYLRLIEDGDKLKIKACYGVKGDYKNKAQYVISIGHGICGEVASTGKYRAEEDVREIKNFEFKELIELEDLRAMLSIPMIYRSRVIGVINCYTCRIHKFTEQEIQIMNTFAAYASIAIQNKKRVDHLIALNEIGSELVKPFEIEELLALILKKARALSGADHLCIKIHNARIGKLETVYSLNCDWQKKNKNLDLNIWGYIEADVIKGESKIISYSDEMRKKCYSLPDNELLMDIKQSALIPIKIENKLFGIIFLDSDRENYFTEDDLLVLDAFSSQAAIALRNARLFDKLQKSTETFPKISELDTDMDKVLKNIAAIAAEVLETDILLLYRWDKERKKIIWPPVYHGDIRELEYMMSEEISCDTPTNLIKKGNSHYVERSHEDPIMASNKEPKKEDFPARFVFREDIVSSAGIVLKVGQEIVGVMFINYRSPHKFDEDERRIIENYASYIAIAIQNVKHFSEKQTAAAMQALGKLAAVIAHKMKNDIGTISLYTGDLIGETSPQDPHYFNLTQIKEKVRKITSDIDNLMVASKKKFPEKEFVDINNLIDEIEQEIASDLKAKDIELEKEINANIPEIKVDPSQIRMVLSNFAYNSIEAMPMGGKIIISISKSKNVLLLDWKDTGKGISPDDGEKVFLPFWTTKSKGFGLGLFLSKSIIEEHGGTISLDLNYKEGARFIIEFPIGELI